jgi:hypothetical protein
MDEEILQCSEHTFSACSYSQRFREQIRPSHIHLSCTKRKHVILHKRRHLLIRPTDVQMGASFHLFDYLVQNTFAYLTDAPVLDAPLFMTYIVIV